MSDANTIDSMTYAQKEGHNTIPNQKKMGIKRKAPLVVAQMMSVEDYPLRGYTEAASHSPPPILNVAAAIAPPLESQTNTGTTKTSSNSKAKTAKVEEDTHLERFVAIQSLPLSTTIEGLRRFFVDLSIHAIYIYFDPDTTTVHAYVKMETVSGAKLAVRRSGQTKGMNVISLTPLEAVMTDRKWIRLEEGMDLAMVRRIILSYIPVELIKRFEPRRAATNILAACESHEVTRQRYVNVEAKQLAKRLLSIRNEIDAIDYFFTGMDEYTDLKHFRQLLLELRTVQLQVMTAVNSSSCSVSAHAECHFIANLLTKWIHWIEVQLLFLLQERQTAAVIAFIH